MPRDKIRALRCHVPDNRVRIGERVPSQAIIPPPWVKRTGWGLLGMPPLMRAALTTAPETDKYRRMLCVRRNTPIRQSHQCVGNVWEQTQVARARSGGALSTYTSQTGKAVNARWNHQCRTHGEPQRRRCEYITTMPPAHVSTTAASSLHVRRTRPHHLKFRNEAADAATGPARA